MKLTANIKAEIRARFTVIETTQQFAELLQWIYENKFPKSRLKIIIEEKHLNYYAFSKSDRYTHFEIPKKNKDEKRPILAPKYKLKVIQKCINEVLNAVFEPHKASYGFIPKKSVVDNALQHIGKPYVYNIDIESFFPSTEFRRVKTVLGLSPFNLKESKEKLAFLIANLCCENGSLPQGAPTSPTLTNIVCQRLDKKLSKLGKKYKARYTRYADDITFSAYNNVFATDFKEELKTILESEENYRINYLKERLQDWNMRQEVTGIVVNKRANVTNQYIKDVRYWLFCWEKFGKVATQQDFERRFPEKKSFIKYKGATIPFTSYLRGKILYIGMVRGKEDKVYIKLKTNLDSLDNSDKADTKETDALEKLLLILDTIDKQGIKKAMRSL